MENSVQKSMESIHCEGVEKGSPNIGAEEPTHVFTALQQRKIRHRVDRRLIGVLGLMYCISLMDRNNMGSAAIAGMTAELELNIGARYSLIVLIFFATYVLFQYPSTLLIRKCGPRYLLPIVTFTWGLVTIGYGQVNHWTGIMALRIVIGLLEAGFFPGAIYLLSCWYTRYDMQKRYAWFYSIGAVSSAFVGILAFGLMQMDGIAGLGGWRWIFIIEGILTCIVGIGSLFILVGFPETGHEHWGFLSKAECDFVIDQINQDRGDALPEPFSMRLFLKGGSDIKIWGYALIYCFTLCVANAISFFLPIILRGQMGFSVGAAQCLVTPPWVFAGIVMGVEAWLCDKQKVRGPIILFNCVMVLIGLPIMGFHPKSSVRYFGVFLVTGFINGNIPAALAWQSNNIVGQWKRAFTAATLVTFGGIGGIAGATVFRSQDAPAYRPGMYAAITSAVLTIITTLLLEVKIYFENKRQAEGEILEGTPGFRNTI